MIFCFLKTKSVENILMYLGGYFLKILRGNSFDKIFEIVRNVRSHFHLRQQKIKLKTVLYGKTRALCKRMFCYIFWQYFYIVITFFAAHSITISNLHLLLWIYCDVLQIFTICSQMLLQLSSNWLRNSQ